MIKWDEPIQAIDGRHARVIAHLPETPGDPNDPGFFTPTMVWISSATNGFGDVFLVNNRGVCCDDRGLFSMRREPIIRNAPVKRKAWISLAMHDFYKADTKEELEARINDRNHFRPVYVEWEE